MTQRRILVTAALPYANGPIHLGHLVEYIQTDIWVRFQKLRGNHCIFICADDTHGTAIMIRARQEGRSEESVIAESKIAHERDFAGFDVAFDNFGSTNSPENEKLCGEMWQSIRAAGLVKEKDIEQLFDVQEGTFLADRFVRGTCPNAACGAKNQPGDNCSKCGSTYTPAELIDPISTLSGTTPEIRKAKHLFIELEQLHDFLDEWTKSDDHLQSEVLNYLKGHFLGDANSPEGRKTLRDWDISRPAPYFGFEIPDSPGNYWYVWFDAPIGYMASTVQWCERNGEQFDDWWRSDDTEIHHFIGKDITYFHTLFWPGMLKSAGFSLPKKVHIHGFLTVNGEKMSKSTGTFVKAETYLKHLDPSFLRYYYASKLGSRLDDIDMNLDEFAAKIDSDLVGKVVNLASRCAKFAVASGLSAEYPDDGGLFAQGAAAGDEIAAAYENCDYNRAMRLILELADRANPYIENAAPWTLKNDPDKAQQLQDICTIGLNLFRQIIVYLAPVLPRISEQTGELLGRPIESWDEAKTPLVGIPVNKFKHMIKRVDRKDLDAMIDESKDEEVTAPPTSQYNDSAEPLQTEPLAEQCTIDDFVKVDLRIARVLTADDVPEANKLLKLTLGLGGDETRTVFAGIKEAYKPDDLIGRLVVCCANLAPRKMKFGVSEGMILASGPGKADVFMLRVDEGGKPGQRVH
ncbi:MAG: methionine--tRNA ligase [Planctomycetaceae bacterium]|nr:methionine--tRNA ligase [Planctomycetales bacterium]MCB9875774.1 methionine--tRNA ligase [Planctomycetaceae bacterium]MCB9939320.1 methionine--tRNA ligase [Planctomycetaceae bacterium]